MVAAESPVLALVLASNMEDFKIISIPSYLIFHAIQVYPFINTRARFCYVNVRDF